MNFANIPAKDITYIINKYGLTVYGDKYLAVWNFLIQNKGILVPKSIENWIVNYNNLAQYDDLPDEIIGKFLGELDVDSLLNYCASDKKMKSLCDLHVRDIYLEKLSQISKLDFSKYSTQNLLKIYRSGLLEDNKVYVTPKRGFVINNNKLEPYPTSKYFHGDIFDMDVLSIVGYQNNLVILTVDGNVYEVDEALNTVKAEGINNIKKISCGPDYVLALDHNGNVYGKGQNRFGRLGFPIIQRRLYEFTKVPDLENIVDISCGQYYSLAVSNDGKVYSFGLGAHGELGYQTNDVQDSIIEIPDLNNIVKVSAGYNYSLYLDLYGNVYLSGIDVVDKVSIKYTPTLIEGINNVVDITAGVDQLFFLTKDGTVYIYGFFPKNTIQQGLKWVQYDVPTKLTNHENTIKIYFHDSLVSFVKSDATVHVMDYTKYGNKLFSIENYPF
jgi:alpha-tubulin suppressor-like RCC1 family protein